jgi:hypothetical protein
MNTNLFGVKGMAERVINDGCYHPVTVDRSCVYFDKYGNTYIGLCVHCIGEGLTIYPAFKATPNNIKGLLLGCDKSNMTFTLDFKLLFKKGETYEMKFDRDGTGLEMLSIMGKTYAGMITFDGEGINNDVGTLSI